MSSAPASAAPADRHPARFLSGLPQEPGARLLVAVLLGVLLVRLLTLGAYPLKDTSEARYGEIARVMLETGNWITPQEIPGIPFWAKPPLYAWLSSVSSAVLGVQEFALRLPSFLCGLGVLVLCGYWARSLQARVIPAGAPALTGASPALTALLSICILAVSVLFFVSAGAVMTDPCLALCTTGILAAFHHAVIRGAPGALARWGFFVAVGLGMLAKGPVILLYAGAPVFLWMLWERRWHAVWTRLPWWRGTLLATLICVPWYVLAESHTPGFLRYFLLGEHVMRFIQPGWGGDHYGTAHAEPLGMIWVYTAGALGLNLFLLPVALQAAWRQRAMGEAAPDAGRTQRRFLLLSALFPLLVFSFAGNIIWTYALPALGPLAIWLGQACAPAYAGGRGARRGITALLLLAGLALSVAVVVWAPRHALAHSAAPLLAQWQAAGGSPSVVYVGPKAPASLRFYTRGTVRTVADSTQALQGMEPGAERAIVVVPGLLAELQAAAARVPGLQLDALAGNSDLLLLRLRAGTTGR